MICEALIRNVCTPENDTLSVAKKKVQTREINRLYERARIEKTKLLGLDIIALRRQAASVPTEGQSTGNAHG